MNWNIYIALIQFLALHFVSAQEKITIHSAVRSIHEDDLKYHLEVIAHDSLEGRETGQPGQRKAALYLASQFKKIGLQPININGKETFLQKFNLAYKQWGEISVSVKGEQYMNLKDILYFPGSTAKVNREIPVVFAGYGTKEEYMKLSCENKAVVVLLSGGSSTREKKVEAAREAGVKDIFFLYGTSDDDLHEQIRLYRSFYKSSRLQLSRKENEEDKEHVFYIPPSIAERIFATKVEDLKRAAERSKKGKTRLLGKIEESRLAFSIDGNREIVETENVIGFVQGTEKPDEVVVISAHYDHVGISDQGIFNGADDNGSGTAAVLELAEAFCIAKQAGMGPRRSVLFVLLTGEEKGLLGSEYYVQNPVFPLDNSIANFNIDMVGRIDKRYVDNPNYVYLIGSDRISSELHFISEKVNRENIGLYLDYTYNDENDPNRYYYRSDHYNFAKHGIPSIFYFTGVHDDYHKTDDVVDKILFDRLERISRLVFWTAWEVANLDHRLSKE